MQHKISKMLVYGTCWIMIIVSDVHEKRKARWKSWIAAKAVVQKRQFWIESINSSSCGPTDEQR